VILLIETADISTIVMARYIQCHDAIKGGDEVSDEIWFICTGWEGEMTIEGCQLRWERQFVAMLFFKQVL
jgi:hypothetical protein